VLLTDPPYGIAYSSGWDNALPGISGDGDTTLRDEVLAAWGDRPALVFGTWKRPAPAGAHTCLVWDKGPHSGMGDLSIPWKPNWEAVYVCGTGYAGRRDSAVVSIAAPVTWNSAGRRHHPHEKPVPLLSSLLAKCPPAWRVLDPFMGSGSTLVAAKARGRRAIGIEVEERYCEIAARRLAQGVMFGDQASYPPATRLLPDADFPAKDGGNHRSTSPMGGSRDGGGGE
jgi:hypothetical protein